MNTITIQRPTLEPITVPLKQNSQQEQKIMGVDVLKIIFEQPNPVTLNIGSSIELYGKTYFLNTAPWLNKKARTLYEYQCTFESYFYDLSKVSFLDTDATGIHITHEFYLTGKVNDFINVIKNNVERVYGEETWAFDVDVTSEDYKTLSFSEKNCQQALIQVCDEFGVEFKLTQPNGTRTVLIRDIISETTSLTFEYGKGKGLYSLARQNASAGNLTTRLFVFGSSKNLGPNYRNYSSRLKLPPVVPIYVEFLNINRFTTPILYIIGKTNADKVQLQVFGNVWEDYGSSMSGEQFNVYYLSYTIPEGETEPPIRIKAWNEGVSFYVYSDGTTSGLPDDNAEVEMTSNTVYPTSVYFFGTTNAANVQLQYYSGNLGKYVDYGDVMAGSYFNSYYLIYTKGDATPEPQVFRIKAWNTKGRYVFSDGTSQIDSPEYLENDAAVAKFGILERTVIFDDVFPQREGSVTSVAGEFNQFIDSTMFDLNSLNQFGKPAYMIPNLEAKVHFNTGKLAGYEFIISLFENDFKRFSLRPITDERGLQLPNPDENEFQIHVGDKYVILDINLPYSYINAAEQLLLSKAQAWLEKYSNEQVSYSLAVDQKYVKDNGISFQVGDKITVVDSELGLNDQLRIVELARNIVQEHQYVLKLADSTYTQSSRTKYAKAGVDSLSLKNSGAISVQMQSDWDEENQQSPAFIKHKPEVKQSDWEQENSQEIDFIKNKPEEMELPSAELPSQELPSQEIYTFETDTGNNDEKPIEIVFSQEENTQTIVFDETKVNHNNLLNFEDDRHRKMNFDENIKAYLIDE